MLMDEPIYQELDGAKAGINPIFGGWSQRFEMAPVPYRDGAISPQGFHKSRVAESGFALHELDERRRAFDVWKATHSAEMKEIQALVAGWEESLLCAGSSPPSA